jgi:tetratricopeptide (TPR) repeat protein
LLSKKGDLRRAVEYSKQALAMRRDLFGERHPDIATSLSNLGSVYGDQGDFQRALEFSEQALGMRRELFGDRHPLVGQTAVKVATLLIRLSRRREAYNLVIHFLTKVPLAAPVRVGLQNLETQLLSQIIHKGFRQPSKKGKSKKRKRK